MYTLGNPLIAIAMIEYEIEAGLEVPVRLAIYESADGKTRLVFNKPSGLMSSLKNERVREAACKLDTEVITLVKIVTGVDA